MILDTFEEIDAEILSIILKVRLFYVIWPSWLKILKKIFFQNFADFGPKMTTFPTYPKKLGFTTHFGA